MNEVDEGWSSRDHAVDTDPVPPEYTFALLLSHDVDRPYKTYQSVYYALKHRDPRHLAALVPGVNPYWQFETLLALEEDLGVRSAFYFLDEQRLLRDRPPRDLTSPKAWSLYASRYDLFDPDIRALICDLDDGGWEVGVHGSYESYLDEARLRREKRRVESILGHETVGIRQHHLNLEVPETWRRQRAAGFRYDTSLGSGSTYGFDHGTGILRPFDDDFVVFPLTIMEKALPNPGTDFDAAWHECERLLDQALVERGVMSVLWHPRVFSVHDFPGQLPLYRRLVSEALDRGAWVGPPGDFYRLLSARSPSVTSTPAASANSATRASTGNGDLG